ncbi:MAG: arginine--tRNA ligase [Spirochaetaceae bacterium]|jgi:arginyl-tRNA synthetase|nr:arginine--tRNA ligase [Spirochaetaceae bacterium]
MLNARSIWKECVTGVLNSLLEENGAEKSLSAGDIIVETPPKPELGDLAFPMFPFAKLLKKAPALIANEAAARLNEMTGTGGGAAAAGPYVNIRLERGIEAKAVMDAALDGGGNFYKSDALRGMRVMVEFSSPNTNKPLHLGHLRNDILGESISRILAASGAEVFKVCIINDRGIHICKSMLAYMEKFAGLEPETAGKKSDRFVGDCYVEFNKMSKTDAGAESRARELLRKWEAGDGETTALWKKMNQWAVNGIKETYKRTGVSFDKYYFESETYIRGKEEVLKGLEKNIFYRDDDGSVWADLTAENLDKKILLRKDGTSVYITQDFGTAILRHEDWPFDKLVYVVGSEQRYHFQVLFTLLLRLGFDWARDLRHLSYGMVNLPEGKMKSREGTVVDADDLIDRLRDMAAAEIREKDRAEAVEAVGGAAETAEKIAIGALHYYLLQVTPEKDMLFNPAESLSFNGNTGPYLQYMGARISSILKKEGVKNDSVNAALLTSDEEWELLKTIAAWPETVKEAAEKMNPSVITAWLYELSKNFSRFYHECPILGAESAELKNARLALCRAVRTALVSAFDLVCIPFLEAM